MDMTLELRKIFPLIKNQDWKSLIKFYKDRPDYLMFPLNMSGDTAFHIAMHSMSEKPFVQLHSIAVSSSVYEDIFFARKSNGYTILHEAASIGNVQVIKQIVSVYPKLIQIENEVNENPLFTAAAFGQTEVVRFFANKYYGDEEGIFQKSIRRYSDQKSILQVAIEGQHFETALLLLKLEGFRELEGKSPWLLEDRNGITPLGALARMPSAFRSGRTLAFLETLLYLCLPVEDEIDCAITSQSSRGEKDLEMCMNTEHRQNQTRSCILPFHKVWPTVEKIWKEKKRHKLALQLARLLIKIAVERHHKTPIFVAIEMGIIEIVHATIEEFPQATEQLNEKKHNILHVAVLNRRHDIFDLLKEINSGLQWKRMTEAVADEGYTLLHQVASTVKEGTRPGPALQLQEELLWFDRVKKIVPSHYAMHRIHYKDEDKDEDHWVTPKQLFDRKHKEQLADAQQWTKDTSQACSTVAALIATVVFAAAFTIPGGLNDRGLPIFLNSPYFLLFTVMDVVSLAFSLTSVVAFLSILTSPFEFREFERSIPQKLSFGFTLLFLSVISTMITFAVTVLLLIQSEKHWTTSLISVAALLPVSVFALLQARLYWALLWDNLPSLRRQFSCSGSVTYRVTKDFSTLEPIPVPIR